MTLDYIIQRGVVCYSCLLLVASLGSLFNSHYADVLYYLIGLSHKFIQLESSSKQT